MDWAKNPKYPEKRGVCDNCKQRGDIKLSTDQMFWVCKNAHACMRRWMKLPPEERKQDYHGKSVIRIEG